MFSRIDILKYFLNNQFLSTMSGGAKRNKIKWTTLQHNGIKFPDDYVQKNIPVIYNNKEILLDKDQEEIAFLYAKYAGSEYSENSTFNKNFFNDWKKYLGKSHEITDLNLCDFSSMKKYLDENKVKQDTSDDTKYKTAIVDGKEQSISIYKMEPPGLFIGRGKNPNLGHVKRRVYPEDVTINIGKESPVPDPPSGHKWGNIIHDRKVEWLASWKDDITGKTKYIWLSPQSDMKTLNDQKKYDIARKLKKKIKSISDINEQNMKSSDQKIMQIATALYFIDKLAIRVGNEKSEDETDTVGVTSLRVEHIELDNNNSITLNFLGKDSVPYTNTINVSNLVYNNVKNLISGKDKYDQVFDKINSNDVNKYLQSFMKDLTAKVFRTYNASHLFQKELRKINNKFENSTDTKAILDEFSKANAKVAKMMNHQKNISTGYKKTVDKITTMLETLKKKLSKAKRKSTKNTATIQKNKDKIKNYKSKKELVKEMKNISLNTSKANYIDPRITVAFLKKHNLDVSKIFSKALQEKFKWAFSVDPDFSF